MPEPHSSARAADPENTGSSVEKEQQPSDGYPECDACVLAHDLKEVLGKGIGTCDDHTRRSDDI